VGSKSGSDSSGGEKKKIFPQAESRAILFMLEDYMGNLKNKILPHASTCNNVLAPKESACSLRTTALFPPA